MWPPRKEKKSKLKYDKNIKSRVAFVLKGGVSKIGGDFAINPESIYRESYYIDYHACARSIKKHIFENNYDKYTFDTFIHSWNPDLEHNIVPIYEPKLSSFEDNGRYRAEILSKITDHREFAGLSSALSMKMGIELVKTYEDLHKFKYDLVIIYRPDLMLWKNINLDLYIDGINKDKIFVNGHPDENGDFHFIMNSKNATIFKNLYDSIDLGNKAISHFWIKNYIINYMKKPLLKDEIIPGRHQEVARKLKDFSIRPNHITEKELVSNYYYNLKLMD